MANVTYDMMSAKAMADLNEQIHIEDHTMGDQVATATALLSCYCYCCCYCYCSWHCYMYC